MTTHPRFTARSHTCRKNLKIDHILPSCLILLLHLVTFFCSLTLSNALLVDIFMEGLPLDQQFSSV